MLIYSRTTAITQLGAEMNIKKIAMFFLKFLPDKLYLSIQYRYHTGRSLNLSHPNRYNEKLQWLKMYDRNPRYTDLVDKYKVKKIIADAIGRKYVVPLLAVWDKPDQICISNLPEKFVLKTNHDSKGVLICKNKKDFNLEEAKRFLSAHMKKNGYTYGREWPYKNVEKKIFAEEYLDDKSSGGPVDYKVLCFNGKARLIQLHQGRFSGHHTRDYYNINWEKQPFNQKGFSSEEPFKKPCFLEEMLFLSETLASGIPCVRVDWYYVNNQLFFGEMTFSDAAGYMDFIPDEYNEIIGSWITLPEKK